MFHDNLGNNAAETYEMIKIGYIKLLHPRYHKFVTSRSVMNLSLLGFHAIQWIKLGIMIVWRGCEVQGKYFPYFFLQNWEVASNASERPISSEIR